MFDYFDNKLKEFFENNQVENLENLYSMYMNNFPKF